MALLLHSLFLLPVHHKPQHLSRAHERSRLSLTSNYSLLLRFSTKYDRGDSSLNKGPVSQRCTSDDLRFPCSDQEVSQDEEGIEEHHKNQRASSILVSPIFNSKNSSFPRTQEDKDAPFVSALEAYANLNVAAFTFPGHNRGRAAPPVLEKLIGKKAYLHDLAKLDDLFFPKGAILDAQKRAAELFGATETWFLVGGTTCGVEASIMATCSPGDTLILSRNSHASALSGLVLSGALPKYIIPDYNSLWEIADRIKPLQVAKAIDELNEEGKEPAAVLITSPTYHGICSDLREIVDLCHMRGIPVIVDEAHGAHFRFDDRLPKTALEQGADLVVQSTHKVLGSLSQSSMLHLSGSMVDRERLRKCLLTLQSTSPSHLLLASLDAARARLSENPYTTFAPPIRLSHQLEDEVQKIPNVSVLKATDFQGVPKKDPMRVTIGTWKLGVSGYEAFQFLTEKLDIIPEIPSGKSVTFAVSLGNCEEHILRVVRGMKDLTAKYGSNNSGQATDSYQCAPFAEISIKLSPRDAFFAVKRRISIEESLGEICGEMICPYPPGIPILIPGEVITQSALTYLLNATHGGAVLHGASDSNLHSVLVCDV